jgi:hypothetical protein
MGPFSYTNARSLLQVLTLSAGLATIGFGTSALAQASSAPYSMGGSTKRFGQDRDRIAQSGQLFRIEGHCQSACTMFLKLKNVCVDPSAELLFHAGNNPQGTQRMLASYNARLRSFLMANHYMDTPQFHTISGSEIIQKFGYRQCPQK